MRFSQPDLPGRACVFNRGQWRCARPAIVTRDRYMVGMGLGDTGGNRADTDFRNQFY